MTFFFCCCILLESDKAMIAGKFGCPPWLSAVSSVNSSASCRPCPPLSCPGRLGMTLERPSMRRLRPCRPFSVLEECCAGAAGPLLSRDLAQLQLPGLPDWGVI